MRDSDWSRRNLLRSDWSGPRVALITTLVNLPFDVRKILCTYPRKRKDIRDLKMFQIGDLSSFLAGGLTCIRRGDSFVSWSGCREDQTP